MRNLMGNYVSHRGYHFHRHMHTHSVQNDA